MQQMTIHFPLIKLYRSQFNLVEERKDKTQKYKFCFNLLIKLKVITSKISSDYQDFFNLSIKWIIKCYTEKIPLPLITPWN